MNKYVVDINKLITNIVKDVRKHGYKCNAEVVDFPTYIDKYTDEEHIIPCPRLREVYIGPNEPVKTVAIISEYNTFKLYDLYPLYWTKKLKHAHIVAVFSAWGRTRIVVFEVGTYKILRNDFITIIGTKVEDIKNKAYKYCRK